MDILQSIIEMDKTAAASTKAAVAEERKRLDEKEKNADSRRAAVLDRNRSAAENSRLSREQALAEKKAETQAALLEGKARLDDIFARSSEAWQSEIISRITGV